MNKMRKPLLVDLASVMKPKKPYADSTLNNMKKSELIEYVRVCEYNYDVAVASLNQQAENIQKITEGWKPVGHAHWVYDKWTPIHCSHCGNSLRDLFRDCILMKEPDYCPFCGYKMDGGKTNE